jgi:hypothetical protein
MATVIKPKKSETANSVPTTSNIVVGEMAVNTADKKIYIRDSNDAIVAVGSAAAGATANAVTKQYILTGTTNNDTETEIFVGGVSNSRVGVAANSTVMYSVDIVARRTDSDGIGAGYNFKGVIDNNAGTVADVGNLYEVIIAEDNTALVADVGADATNDTIYVKVTGISGHTYRWVATLTTTEAKE